MVGIIRSEVILCFFPKIGYLQIARLMITVFSLYCHFGVSIFRHTQKRVQKMLQEGGGSYNPTYLQFGRSSWPGTHKHKKTAFTVLTHLCTFRIIIGFNPLSSISVHGFLWKCPNCQSNCKCLFKPSCDLFWQPANKCAWSQIIFYFMFYVVQDGFVAHFWHIETKHFIWFSYTYLSYVSLPGDSQWIHQCLRFRRSMGTSSSALTLEKSWWWIFFDI